MFESLKWPHIFTVNGEIIQLQESTKELGIFEKKIFCSISTPGSTVIGLFTPEKWRDLAHIISARKLVRPVSTHVCAHSTTYWVQTCYKPRMTILSTKPEENLEQN